VKEWELVGEPTRRRRTGRTIVSLVLLLVVSANRAEHHPGSGSDDGGSTGILSTLGDVPDVLIGIARFIAALKNS
jgi:hypothetical protein